VGIPVAMMTAIPVIPLTVGANRVIRGVRVPHVVGDPSLSVEKDREMAMKIVLTALRALETSVDGPTLFEPAETPFDPSLILAKEAIRAA
jgi:glycine reductase